MKHTLKKPQYFIGLLVVLITAATSYLVYTHPKLNMAALYNALVTGDNASSIYVPSYEADLGEEGVMEVKAKANTQPFDSVSFVMNYPTNALSFDADAIVFDNQTLFQNASVKQSTLKAPGQLEVTLVLNAPVSVQNVTTSDPATHKTLFKLNTMVSEGLTDGQKLDLTFSNFAASNGNQPMNFPQLPATSITLKAAQQQSNLNQVTLTAVAPKAISNQAEVNVTLSGTNLNLVKKVWVGTQNLTILNQSMTAITVKVPLGLAPGLYDVVFFDENDASVSFNDQLTITGDGGQEENVSPDAPKISLDRSYTNPVNAVNDGKTPLTLYTYVEDADLKSVIANLTHIGQVGPENGGVLGQEANEDLKTVTCPTASNVIVCMKPSVKEGSGQWFMLSDITVSKAVQNSQTPYQVQVLAIDEQGNSSTKMIPIYVGSSAETAAPKPLVAVATSETTLEVLFNKEIDAATVNPASFTVTSSANASLSVSGAALDSSGKIVTVTTASQIPSENYSLSVSAGIKDLQGKSLSENQLTFEGFTPLNKAPILDYISTLDSNVIELEFTDPLKLSSLLNMKVEVFEADDSTKKLTIQNTKLLASNLIRLETDNQSPEKKYRVMIEGLQSYDGTALPVPINKGFKGYNAPLVHHAATARLADLDNNGTVDFADFTIFSSVYGTVYEGDTE